MLKPRRRSGAGERGWAMMTVLWSVMLMTIFATLAIGVAGEHIATSARESHFQTAEQAAQAGVDDYVARLQGNPNYFVQGVDAANPAMTGWATLPGGTSAGQFHYAIDASQAYTTGILTITATGRVAGVDRTVSAELKKSDFLDYMYFTKYETIDPQAYQAAAAPPAGTNCAIHQYESRSTDCAAISFQGSDVLQGPVHSQDEINLSGSPTFRDEFSTEWQDPAQVYWTCYSGPCAPSFSAAHPPSYSVVPFPSTNTTLAQYADPSQGGQGCLFQGPTRIVLNPPASSSAPGTMTVLSPETPSTFNTGACGIGIWTSARTVNVPTGQVVYVESPIAKPTCTLTPPGFPYPVSGDTSTASNPQALQPSCSHGDAYVQGWLKGQLTIGAANNIYVTDSVRYVGSNAAPSAANLDTGIPTTPSQAPPAADTTGNDVLGLSANNFVVVYHPLTNCTASQRNSSRTTLPGSCPSAGNAGTVRTNLELDGALVASNDSILVADWDSGPILGELSVDGGLIQAFRGPVGTIGTTGYAKNYVYDSRLRALSPPHLADLASSAWNEIQFAEGQTN